MNVLSRILGALVALALAKLGQWLGVTFTDADVADVTLWMVAVFTALYGLAHPLVRSRIVAWTGKGARVEDNVTPPVAAPNPDRRFP